MVYGVVRRWEVKLTEVSIEENVEEEDRALIVFF